MLYLTLPGIYDAGQVNAHQERHRPAMAQIRGAEMTAEQRGCNSSLNYKSRSLQSHTTKSGVDREKKKTSKTP